MEPSLPFPPQQKKLHIRLIREVRTKMRLSVWVITAGLLASLAGIGGAWSLSQAVGAVFLRGELLSGISAPLVLLLVLIIARGLLTWASDTASNTLAVQIKTSLRERVLAHILKLGPAYTQRTQTGDLLNLLTEGAETLQPYYSQFLPQAVFAVLIPLVSAVLCDPHRPAFRTDLISNCPHHPHLHGIARQRLCNADAAAVENAQPFECLLPRYPARADHAETLGTE